MSKLVRCIPSVWVCCLLVVPLLISSALTSVAQEASAAESDLRQEQADTAGVPEFSLMSEEFPAHLQLALEAYNDGRDKECIKLTSSERLGKQRSVAASLYQVHRLRGLCLQRRGEDQRAISEFDSALRLRGSDVLSLFARALSLRSLGQDREAQQSLQEALWFRRSEQVPVELIFVNLAEIALSVENRSKALEFLRQAHSANPSFVPAILLQSELELQEGNKQEALRLLRALREQLPEDQRVHLQFAFTVLHEVDTRLEQADLLESERLLQLLIDGSAKNDQLTRAYPLLVRTQLTLARLDQASKTIDAGIGREIAQEELLSLREQLEVQRAARDEIGKVVNRDGMEQEDSG